MNKRLIFSWCLLLGVNLIPIWAFDFVPTEDGPSHVLNSIYFRNSVFGVANESSQELQLRAYIVPNLAFQASYLLMGGCLSPYAFERVFLSVFFFAMPLSAAYLASKTDCSPAVAAITASILSYSHPFFMGFYNYCISVPLALLAFSLVVNKEMPSARSVIFATLLVLLVWLSHLGGVCVAAVLYLLEFLKRPQLKRTTLFIPFILPSILTITYSASSYVPPGAGHEMGWSGCELSSLFECFATCFGDHQRFSSEFLMVLTMILFFTHFLALTANTRSNMAKSLTLGAAIFLIAVVVVPDSLGLNGGYFHSRFLQAAILLLAFVPCCGRYRRSHTALVTVLTLLMIWNTYAVARDFELRSEELNEFTAALNDRGGTRIAYLEGGKSMRPRANPFGTAVCHYCIPHGRLQVGNYELDMKHFPVTYKEGSQPRTNDGAWLTESGVADTLVCWDVPKARLRSIQAWERRIVFRTRRLVVFE